MDQKSVFQYSLSSKTQILLKYVCSRTTFAYHKTLACTSYVAHPVWHGNLKLYISKVIFGHPKGEKFDSTWI